MSFFKKIKMLHQVGQMKKCMFSKQYEFNFFEKSSFKNFFFMKKLIFLKKAQPQHSLVILICFLSFSSILIGQTTVNLPPTDDTFISNHTGSSGRNYGSCQTLDVRGNNLARSLLLFDLSSIPTGANILSANLKLNKNSSDAAVAQNVKLHRVTTAWTEGTLCDGSGSPNYSTPWTNSGGDFDATPVATTNVGVANVVYSWEVTALVGDWLDNTFLNYGMLLDIGVTDNQFIYFDSKETISGIAPELEITYSSMSLSTTTTNETCSGDADGSIDLTVTNGTNPITYAWSDGPTTEDRTGLTAGTYTVTVTDANESKVISATVGVTTPMNLSTVTTPLSGVGATDGAIDLIIEDGLAPFTYTWSNGATTEDISGLGAGTYTVTVTDACALTATTSATLGIIVDKFLYLTDPSQGLDRIDPVATGDATTANTISLIATESAAIVDNFDTNSSYTGSNSTGSLDWSGLWVETDPDGGGAASGGVRVASNALQIHDNSVGQEAYREANLSTVTSAFLSFDFTNAMNHSGDNVTIELSKDGGVTYPHLIAVFNQSTINGTKNFTDLVTAFGTLTTNTRLRFRVSGTGGAGANYSSYDNISIAYTRPGSASETFTQGTAMCSDFTIKSGQDIVVTTYTTITSGTMPANPDITATLQYGIAPTTIITLTNPTYASATGLLTWTGTLGSSVTVPAGEEITLVITTNESAVAFQIDYDSDTKPSKIQLPTETFINVDAFAVYDAPYPGGSIITSENTNSTVYIRSMVSDPFGFDDITGMDIEFTDSNGFMSTVAANSVATSGCTRTYEYIWTTPNSPSGIFSIKATAHEGTEGVSAESTLPFQVISPVVITKVLLSPATGPYTLDDVLSYKITIVNNGANEITTLPLQDIFNEDCLEFVSTSVPESSVNNGTITWNDLGNLPSMASTAITVDLRVVGNCDPALNIAQVQGAVDVLSNTIPTNSDTASVIIDEPPVANDDQFCVSGTETLDVLANDIDPDNDMTTLTITVPAGVGTATVNGDNTINYVPGGGMADNDLDSFTYQICDNADVTPYCVTATVEIAFSTVNDPPTAVNDVVATTLDLPVTFSVVDNDSDIDGSIDASSVSIISGTTFGSTAVNPDGTIYYVPNPGFSGIDQLTYQVCDNGCPTPVQCATATVDISVVFVQYVCTSSTSDMVSVPAVPGAVGYTWTLPPGTVVNSGTNTNTLDVDWSGVASGTYTICALAVNECGNGSQICEEIVVNTVVLNTEPSDVLCHGENTGEIDLSVSGGIPAYTYNWDNGASVEDLTNVPVGTYNVTVTDKYGCFASTAETLTEPATALSLSGTTTDENPYGNANGTIDITVTGGTPIYIYDWSSNSINEDLSGLSGGTYAVTVTDLNGCRVLEKYTVNTIGGPLSVSSIEATDVNCFNGSDGTINLEIVGGVEPYTYDWDNDGVGDNDDPQDLTGLMAGTYNVTVTDNVGATTLFSATVNQPATAVAAATTATNVTCHGNTDGAVNLTASGGTPPYTYNWSTGAISEDLSNLSAGTYTVTVTDDNGCTAVASQPVTEPVALVASGTTIDTPCDPGNMGSIDITVSGGSPPYTYNWSTGATSQDISGLTAGNYAVTITDNNSCKDIQSFVIHSVCLGLAKTVSSAPVNNNDGTYTLTYQIKIKNEGDIILNDIQVNENFNTAFSSAIGFSVGLVFSSDVMINGSFNGTSITDLLASSQSLVAGDSALVSIMLTVTPGATLGVYNNSVSGTASSTEGVITSDISQNGTDTDPENDGPFNNSDPTPVSFTENPLIGIAKNVLNGPINNGDGTYDLTYQIIVRNMGDVPLSNIQVTDNLNTTFNGQLIPSIA